MAAQGWIDFDHFDHFSDFQVFYWKSTRRGTTWPFFGGVIFSVPRPHSMDFTKFRQISVLMPKNMQDFNEKKQTFSSNDNPYL